MNLRARPSTVSGLILLIAFSAWWLLWLFLSKYYQKTFTPPSDFIFFVFLVVVALFFIGGLFSCFWFSGRREYSSGHEFRVFPLNPILFVSFSVLILEYYLTGSIWRGYKDQFYFVRGAGVGSVEFTFLSVLIKFIVFPVIFFVFLKFLSEGVLNLKLLASVIFIMMYVYLYQVNYPVIYMIWSFFISFIFYRGRSKFILLVTLCSLLLFFAFTRYGGADFFGVLEYYFLNYHVVGFTLFDHYISDNSSPVHDHSYGLAVLGPLSQSLGIAFNKLGVSDYLHNHIGMISEYTQEPVDVGLIVSKYTNAFNTILFTFYKDFGWFGVLLYPFFLGFFLMQSYFKSGISLRFRIIFKVLSLIWILGFMVSPFQRPVFMFVIVLSYILLSRIKGVKSSGF